MHASQQLSANTTKPRVQAFCHLSIHAFMRVSQRIRLTPETVMQLLDSGAVVNVGRETATNRDHLLFYSDADHACFVAIQDHLTGQVVTVLPLDYHDNLAWPVTAAQQEQARHRAMTMPRVCFSAGFANFEIRAHYLCPAEQRMKTANLGRIPRTDSLPCTQKLMLSDVLQQHIVDKMADKPIAWADLLNFSVRAGKEAIPVFLNVDDVSA